MRKKILLAVIVLAVGVTGSVVGFASHTDKPVPKAIINITKQPKPHPQVVPTSAPAPVEQAAPSEAQPTATAPSSPVATPVTTSTPSPAPTPTPAPTPCGKSQTPDGLWHLRNCP